MEPQAQLEEPKKKKPLHKFLLFRIFRVFALAIFLTAIGAWSFNIFLYKKYTTPIVMYHAVNTVKNPITATVHPDIFRYHMEYFKNNGYNVISFSEYINKKKSEEPVSHKSVVITFDDGHEDNYTYAYKILKEYGYPAIMFVSSDFIGTDGYLKWHQILEMMENGIEIGSHTRQHAYLPDLLYVQQYDEVFESKTFLEKNLNTEIKYFAYPMGGFDDKVKDLLQEAGYVASCTTNRGTDRYNNDLYEINRIRLGDKDDSDVILWAKLTGYYNLFRRLRNSH